MYLNQKHCIGSERTKRIVHYVSTSTGHVFQFEEPIQKVIDASVHIRVSTPAVKGTENI